MTSTQHDDPDRSNPQHKHTRLSTLFIGFLTSNCQCDFWRSCLAWSEAHPTAITNWLIITCCFKASISDQIVVEFTVGNGQQQQPLADIKITVDGCQFLNLSMRHLHDEIINREPIQGFYWHKWRQRKCTNVVILIGCLGCGAQPILLNQMAILIDKRSLCATRMRRQVSQWTTVPSINEVVLGTLTVNFISALPRNVRKVAIARS